MTPKDRQIGFGGGCHWCTEAVFAALRGVSDLRQGFIRALPPDDAYSEAVMLIHDPQAIPFDTLIEVHLRTHASMSNHKLRGKYRSAIYVSTDAQRQQAIAALADLQPLFPEPLVTRVLPLAGFRASDPRFHDYARKNAGNQFCTRYIDPKLAEIRARYADYMRRG